MKKLAPFYILTASFFLASTAFAEESYCCAKVHLPDPEGVLNVREGPGFDFPKSGELESDASNVNIMFCVTDGRRYDGAEWSSKSFASNHWGTWCSVRSSSASGWVNTHYLKADRDWASQPQTLASPPSADTVEWNDRDLQKLDEWILTDLRRYKDAALQYAMIGVPESEIGIYLKQKIGFVENSTRMIQAHPDWTSEDVLLELSNDPLIQNIDKDLVRYLVSNKIGESILMARVTELDQLVQKCEQKIANMRPTQRPKNPTETCHKALLEKTTQ